MSAKSQMVMAGDFTKDGNADIAVANGGVDKSVFVFQGNGGGAFTLMNPPNGFPTISSPVSIGSADFNGDTNIDIVVNTTGNDGIDILQGSAFTTVTPTPGSISAGMAVANFGGDAGMDVGMANADGSLSIMVNPTPNSFNLVERSWSSGGQVNGPRGMTSADFNSDGFNDVAIANFGADNAVVWLHSGSIGNNNLDLFDTTKGSTITPLALPPTSNPQAITAGDFNKDGKPDIAVANTNTDNVSIFINNGNGTFAAGVVLPDVTDDVFSLATADFNLDGNLDFAAANFGTKNIGVFLGNGDGTFKAQQTFSAGANGPRAIAVADFNKDNKSDIVTANDLEKTLSVFLNTSQ